MSETVSNSNRRAVPSFFLCPILGSQPPTSIYGGGEFTIVYKGCLQHNGSSDYMDHSFGSQHAAKTRRFQP